MRSLTQPAQMEWKAVEGKGYRRKRRRRRRRWKLPLWCRRVDAMEPMLGPDVADMLGMGLSHVVDMLAPTVHPLHHVVEFLRTRLYPPGDVVCQCVDAAEPRLYPPVDIADMLVSRPCPPEDVAGMVASADAVYQRLIKNDFFPATKDLVLCTFYQKMTEGISARH